LNAYRAFQKGERPHTPHNWLIKIAHNVCRMRWRQSGRRPQEVPLEHAAEPAGPDDDKPPLDEVLQALAQLPLNQRAAIVMREVEGRSYAEIAEVLGTTVPAIEALLFRARSSLRARRDSLGALTLAPLPGSLSSFLGGGGAGVVAAGGAALGTQIALKAAAVVATGVVAGGLGFKAVKAVAKPDAAQPQSRQAQASSYAAPAWANPVQRIVPKVGAGGLRTAGPLHPGRVSGLGPSVADPRKAPMNETPSEASAPARESGSAAGSDGAAAGAAPGAPGAPVAAPAAGAGGSTTVNKIVAKVPPPPTVPAPVPLPPPPTLPAVTVTVPTVTVPTVTVPTVTVPTLPVPPPPPILK
ncbi:MAG TPA: RNA polymerase sigma factor, partial [Thermoanaerobaculia bacterium]|nr:RNA polymerase sigma factor [Thermoanaerobaculia bacterium]